MHDDRATLRRGPDILRVHRIAAEPDDPVALLGGPRRAAVQRADVPAAVL